jgi:hypothetical protein
MKSLVFTLLFVSASALALPPSTFFVANEGQWDGAFSFRCDLGPSTYFVTPTGMTIDLKERLETGDQRLEREPRTRFEERDKFDPTSSFILCPRSCPQAQFPELQSQS